MSAAWLDPNRDSAEKGFGFGGAVGPEDAEDVGGGTVLFPAETGGGKREGATEVGGANGPECREEERGGAELTEGEEVGS